MSMHKPIISIFVRHNIEIAHRLFLTPGKCQNIHGHGMQVKLELTGNTDAKGMLAGMDFHTVKKTFRGYLDDKWDHHLHLNQDDTLTGPNLPGLVIHPGDPTTENIAKWIWEWCYKAFSISGVDLVAVTVDETKVNGASVS